MWEIGEREREREMIEGEIDKGQFAISIAKIPMPINIKHTYKVVIE